VVSTDDDDIKDVVRNLGVRAYDRPDYLATDSAGKVETITDVLAFQENKNGKKYEYVLDLDVTSPLRTLEDLSQGFTILKNDDEAYNIYSVNLANRNPYFNMVEQKKNGYYHLVKEGSFLSRQAAPVVYDMNASFYFFKKSFFTSGQKTSTTTNSLIYVMPHVCFDLDHIIDFEFMEFLMSTNKLGFNL
jgi:CMP-N-acetylneuraminic acid synthetase